MAGTQHETGEGLIALQSSKAIHDFEGTIETKDNTATKDAPPIVEVIRNEWLPIRVVAIDGSTLTHKVKNGYPGAEASILMLSVVFIDITELASIVPHEIPSPRVFNEMDTAKTLDGVLPGANVVRAGTPGDTPVNFFRSTVQDILSGTLDPSHETLLETLRAITVGRQANIACPIDDCKEKYKSKTGSYKCDCERNQTLFETDALRFHERFNEIGSNGEVHGEVRRVVEVLSLINILRYFEDDKRIHYLKNCAFVLDGPLAVFGQPAWIAPYVQKEIQRISAKSLKNNGCDLLLFGIEKSGQYMTHFSDIDWTDEQGPRSKFDSKTAIIPNAKYINRNIVFRPEDAKPSGIDTYFGRKVLYKTANGSHAVLNSAIVNSEGLDFHNTSPSAFPRLGDALNVLDHLSTYLYEDGFMPLVRAHAHAAIPLKQGAEILRSLFNLS
ncbi:DNA double-strand break repair nuclease NurA [Bradyrhizobium japonicum]|uniref:DNA double-strand break repair nuclease NurA n=1 Tax=Bradyrhizobium japonicum TaxID=375 RepID=UPI001BA892ED|nr:DNA double-strand break repair nuclease NurA [Bradyrhizobium japonicum]MBR0960840.1 DNA double-strand break repair nuclease NurA [Bradyrhizobium japonicum]